MELMDLCIAQSHQDATLAESDKDDEVFAGGLAFLRRMRDSTKKTRL